jgi:hypothetical protein
MANRYENIQTVKSVNNRNYKHNVIYPEIAPSPDDFYVITSVGDRYDILAKQFYNDHTLWWIIASANNAQKASLIPTPGIQIRIPGNKDQVIQLYNRINKIR